MKDIFNYQPQTVEVEYGPEPSIHQLILAYYIDAGYSGLESIKYTTEYIKAIEKEYF